MANPHRGEVDLTVGDKTYTLRLSINAMVEVEQISGLGISDIIAELQAAPKLGTLRTLLWGALREHHPKMSLVDAGDIIGEIGIQAVADAVGEALSKSFPAPDGGRPSPVATQG